MTENKNIAYFIGIGGIGMSALARYFKSLGWEVSGYDRTETALTNQLVQEGIDVHYTDAVDHIPQRVRKATHTELLIVYTPAIPADNAEKNYFADNGYKLYKRSEVLGHLSASGKCIAVAGTHGKTTTSTLIAHILHESGFGCNAFLGGIATNYNTNLLLNKNATCTVVEADEYDRSFLKLHPYVAVITSMDADHLDIYGSAEEMHTAYNAFAHQVVEGGILIYKSGLPLKITTGAFSYSVSDPGADYTVKNLLVENGVYTYAIRYPGGECENVRSGLPGKHNVENALAAFAAAHRLGVDVGKIVAAVASYRGVKRRFEYILRNDKIVFIDDYAHHPEELRACISSVREMYPKKKITGVFQPHLYTRTRDFADGFAASLALLDELVMLEIYPARELPIAGITSQWLLDKVKMQKKSLRQKNELADYLQSVNPEVLLTLGAGDIDKLVEPVREALSA